MNPSNYFDFIFAVEQDVPTFTIKVKKEWLTKPTLLRDNSKMPVSPSEEKYFVYHFGETGIELYQFYKQFFNKEFAFEYAKQLGLVSETEQKIVVEYFEQIKNKTKQKHLASITPEYKEKLKKAYNRSFHSKLKKDWFAIPANKTKMAVAINKPEVQQKIREGCKKWLENGGRESFKEACNKPERKEKISKAAKKMWQEASLGMIKNMLHKFSKTEFVQGNKMNKLEAKMATILEELGLHWEYEPLLQLESNYFPDFLLKDTKLVIECYGDYWHGNPAFYAEEEMLFEAITAKEVRLKDKLREEEIKNAGYRFLCFWETDILNKKELIKEQIKKATNV